MDASVATPRKSWLCRATKGTGCKTAGKKYLNTIISELFSTTHSLSRPTNFITGLSDGGGPNSGSDRSARLPGSDVARFWCLATNCFVEAPRSDVWLPVVAYRKLRAAGAGYCCRIGKLSPAHICTILRPSAAVCCTTMPGIHTKPLRWLVLNCSVKSCGHVDPVG